MASWLNKKLSKEIECIQKRCLNMVFPTLSYSRALDEAELDRLDVCRETSTKDMFSSLRVYNHILHSL
jgi:hypothetical protein